MKGLAIECLHILREAGLENIWHRNAPIRDKDLESIKKTIRETEWARDIDNIRNNKNLKVFFDIYGQRNEYTCAPLLGRGEMHELRGRSCLLRIITGSEGDYSANLSKLLKSNWISKTIKKNFWENIQKILGESSDKEAKRLLSEVKSRDDRCHYRLLIGMLKHCSIPNKKKSTAPWVLRLTCRVALLLKKCPRP